MKNQQIRNNIRFYKIMYVKQRFQLSIIYFYRLSFFFRYYKRNKTSKHQKYNETHQNMINCISFWMKNDWFYFGQQQIKKALIPQYMFSLILRYVQLKRYQMSIKQSDTLHNIDHAAVSELSPDDLVNAEISELKPQSRSSQRLAYIRCNIKKYLFIALLLISSSVFIFEINAAGPIIVQPPQSQDQVLLVDAFTFLVYCPQSYYKPTIQNTENEDDLRRRLYYASTYTVQAEEEYNRSNLYIVQIRSLSLSNNDSSLFYCGLVRAFDGSCQNAKYLCSTPGPMFDLQTYTATDIVWLNFVNSSIPINMSTQDPSSCLLNQTDPRCILEYKTLNAQDQTFNDPTIHIPASHPNVKQVRINPRNWPISTHVHGAEVRPTFDGHPLSWIDNEGLRGLGALSLNDTCYYNQFTQFTNVNSNISFAPPKLIVKSFDNIPRLTKINRYPNSQNPGNLWYHDHAMRLTTYNVRNGLSGIYILRDPVVQTEIGVHLHHEKFVMLTVDGWKQGKLESLEENIVYRFRFLNNYFGFNSPQTISFSYQNCTDPIASRINFTIIGADSSLFNQGIEDQTSFEIAQAERIELLVQFSRQANKNNQVSICSGAPTVNAVNKNLYVVSTTPLKLARITPHSHKNIRTSIKGVKLSVPYTDFSSIPEQQIAVKRMRPLISTPGPLTINGRYDFHHGRSQNPKIGTFQDWFIINTMGGSHPIHIHLINFQIINELYLKYITVNTSKCALYQLDFIAQAILKGSHIPEAQRTKYFDNYPRDNKTINYYNICLNKKAIYGVANFSEDVQFVNVEDQKDKDRVSGINVRKSITIQDAANILKLKVDHNITVESADTNPNTNATLFYVTNLSQPTSKVFYKKWKDTASVAGLKAFQFRIRWAKSAYNASNPKDTYFHVPADQLRQYPGFVYHCHILAHQDNEMMRPIMLQLPDDAFLDQKVTCNQDTNTTWAKKYECINRQCQKKSKK